MILSKFFKNHLTIPQATKLFEEVKTQTHPDIADLKRLVGFHKVPVGTKDEMQALDLKYRAMTHIPTTIEKTMSLPQLWQSDSPFWTEKLDGYQIVDVIYAYSWSDKSRDEFDFENSYNNAKHPLHRRLNNHIPFVSLDKELLNEEPKCNKCLTPLIY